jgi:translation initiation factor 1
MGRIRCLDYLLVSLWQPPNFHVKSGKISGQVIIRTSIYSLKLLYTSEIMIGLRFMAEVCPTCGLPKDLCVCGEIEKEQQRIRIRLETRKFGRPTTIIDGIDDRNSALAEIAHKLKAYSACGGTAKNGLIMLQGDHRDRVREYLVKTGYPEENIELQ